MSLTDARFSRILLRTTDIAAAGAFYDAVLGRRADGIVALPATAIARGARPHWLGHVGVAQLGGVARVAERLVERGAMRLGPAGASEEAILRGPGGAVVALTETSTPSSAGIVWHQLNAEDAARTAEAYADVFGWALGDEFDVPGHGRQRAFAFRGGEPIGGAIGDVAGRPGVHTHWLFFFGVPALDAAIAEGRSRGGLVLGPTTSPTGKRLAVCDDPEGAAFGLMEA